MKRAILILVALLVIAGFCVWKNWRDRYVWPAPVASMKDLPPLDKSGWPATPVAWTTESTNVLAATPDGLKPLAVTYYTNSIGMKLVRVEPGTFRMGLSEEDYRRFRYMNQCGHQVTLTKRYYLGAFEVTNTQFEQYDPAHVVHRPSYQRGHEGDNHPVVGITWRDSQKFCRWLSVKDGHLYRLPTEAEWEYACKAGTTTRTYWGNATWDRNMANVGGLKENKETWLEDGWIYNAPVGLFPPNPWGFYDMIGNAWEWVNDWYEPFTADPQVDPQGPPNRGHFRAAKGGSWSTCTRHLTSSMRDGNNPADLDDIRGFRVLCEAK